jgi:hypothetical protein
MKTIEGVIEFKQDEYELDRRLLRRYALEAVEFLHSVMLDEAQVLEDRIKAAEILAVSAGVPTKEDED